MYQLNSGQFIISVLFTLWNESNVFFYSKVAEIQEERETHNVSLNHSYSKLYIGTSISTLILI